MELELPFELWLLVAAETCDADSIRSLRCVNKRLSEEFKKYEKVLIIKTKTIFDGSKYHGTWRRIVCIRFYATESSMDAMRRFTKPASILT